jgi:hypothetical protein
VKPVPGTASYAEALQRHADQQRAEGQGTSRDPPAAGPPRGLTKSARKRKALLRRAKEGRISPKPAGISQPVGLELDKLSGPERDELQRLHASLKTDQRELWGFARLRKSEMDKTALTRSSAVSKSINWAQTVMKSQFDANDEKSIKDFSSTVELEEILDSLWVSTLEYTQYKRKLLNQQMVARGEELTSELIAAETSELENSKLTQLLSEYWVSKSACKQAVLAFKQLKGRVPKYKSQVTSSSRSPSTERRRKRKSQSPRSVPDDSVENRASGEMETDDRGSKSPRHLTE